MSGWTGAGFHQLARLNSANLAWHFGRRRASAERGGCEGCCPRHMHITSHDCYHRVYTVRSQMDIDVV